MKHVLGPHWLFSARELFWWLVGPYICGTHVCLPQCPKLRVHGVQNSCESGIEKAIPRNLGVNWMAQVVFHHQPNVLSFQRKPPLKMTPYWIRKSSRDCKVQLAHWGSLSSWARNDPKPDQLVTTPISLFLQTNTHQFAVFLGKNIFSDISQK